MPDDLRHDGIEVPEAAASRGQSGRGRELIDREDGEVTGKQHRRETESGARPDREQEVEPDDQLERRDPACEPPGDLRSEEPVDRGLESRDVRGRDDELPEPGDGEDSPHEEASGAGRRRQGHQ